MLLRIRMQQVVSPESENDVVWSWGFAGPPIAANALRTACNFILDSLTIGQPTGLTVAQQLQPLNPLYAEVFDNWGGPATAIADLTDRANVGSAGPAPAEVQLVVSRLCTSPRGPAPIGRLYVGPLGGVALDAARPSTAGIVTTLADWAWMLHQSMQNLGLSPVVIRNFGHATKPITETPIVGYRVDNAWDTQRRRGLQPNDRVTRPA